MHSVVSECIHTSYDLILFYNKHIVMNGIIDTNDLVNVVDEVMLHIGIIYLGFI
jgi:hypothetical protein